MRFFKKAGVVHRNTQEPGACGIHANHSSSRGARWRSCKTPVETRFRNAEGFLSSPGTLSTRAMSLRATMELALIKPHKKIFELGDCIITVIVRQKTPPKPDNDNLCYDFWGDELKEFLDRYDK